MLKLNQKERIYCRMKHIKIKSTLLQQMRKKIIKEIETKISGEDSTFYEYASENHNIEVN